MDAGRGSYFCGLVFGVAIGVAGTHVALSGRPVQSETRLAEFPLEPLSPADVPHVDIPAIDFTDADVRTAFAPEPSTVHAIATKALDAAPPPTSDVVPEPPKRLPEIVSAAPLTAEPPREDPELRAFIPDELQTLAASEHDVWYDTLKGLSREDATEILRLWKLTREFRPAQTLPYLSEPVSRPVEKTLPLAEAVPTVKRPPAARESRHAELQRLFQLNLANAATPGFKRRESMIFEHLDDRSARSASTGPVIWLNTCQGRITQTGRSFDCAIRGKGFFQVQRGDERLLTRCGRFVLDNSGRLAVPRSQGEPCPLVPSITAPETFARIRIDSMGAVVAELQNGETESIGSIVLVDVADASALEPVGDNLLQITSASGEATSLSSNEGAVLVQGSIEESNVDPHEERRKLDALAARENSL